MKRGIALAVLLAAALRAGVPEKPRVRRAALAAMEKNFDGRIERIGAEDPFMLLGTTRGVYLEGYGVVFTAEVNLVNSPGISPFRQSVPKEEIASLRIRKLQRLAVLKQNIEDMLVASAALLSDVPDTEQITVGVSLFYRSYEDTTGLPSQILMQAERRKLLQFQPGRIDRAALESIIRVQEF